MSEQPAPTSTPTWDLADRLRKALREADVTVAQMAEHLEVSRNTVGSWINGHHRPRPSDLKQWALRTGVSYLWLLHGDPPATPSAAALTPQPPGWFVDLAAVHVQLHNPLHMLAHGPVTVSGDRELPDHELLTLRRQLKDEIRRGTTRLTRSRQPARPTCDTR